MFALSTKFAPRRSQFEAAAAAGFRHAEFWLDAALLEDGEQVARLAGEYDMRYVLHFPNRRDLTKDHLRQFVELYRALDCQASVIHAPMWREYAETIHGYDSGVVLAVENHRFTPEELDTWMGAYEALTLDIEHIWKFTLNDAPLAELQQTLTRVLATCGEKVRHVHLPGYYPGDEEHRPMYCSRDMVLMAFDQLAHVGYDGFVVAEANDEFQNAHELAMDRLLHAHWLTIRAEEAAQSADAMVR